MSTPNKPVKDFKSLRIAFGKKTKLGGWSEEFDLDTFEFFQTLTKDQIVGAKLSHREIVSTNKKTGEQFSSIVYEILLPERVLEMKERMAKFTKVTAPADSTDDL